MRCWKRGLTVARPRTPIGAHGAISVVLLDDGSWRARTRFRFEDGRLRQVERFDTSGPKARRKLLAALTTIKATTSGTINQHTPLSRLADRYVENKRTGGVAPTTLAAYERTLSKIVLPALGELAVLEATPERLQRFMDQVIAKHGPASAKMCRAVLSGMLGLAVRNDAARTNAVRELERVSQRRDGATALNAEQLQDLLTRADLDERVQALDLADLLRFMAGTGCRIGEACAMIWEDVYPGAVHIHSTVVRLRGQGLLRQEHGKTQGSDRRIAIPEHVDEMLKRRASDRGVGSLVFPSVLGNLRDPNNTQADWRGVRESLGFPGVKLHAFRKTVATLLDGAGLSARDVAEYLGHKNPSMTQDRYMGRNTGSAAAARALSALTHGAQSAG